MADERETRVIQIVSSKGPMLQTDVAKGANLDGFVAGAILSTLANRGELKISYRKIGSSPLYYVPGQEAVVRNKLYAELNELEKKALERLKTLKVALKEELYPQERVLLSELRDFVDYLQVNINGEDVLCWKHNTVPGDEFEAILNSKFSQATAVQEESALVVEQGEIILGEEPEKKKGISKETFSGEAEEMEGLEKIESSEDTEVPEKTLKPVEKPKRKKPVSKEPKGAFEQKVIEHAKKIGLKMLEKISVRGDPEYIVSAEVPFGEQKYLFKAKNKSLNENDVSRFYVGCSAKKMPGIFLTTKPLGKKVKLYFENHFGSLIKILVL